MPFFQQYPGRNPYRPGFNPYNQGGQPQPNFFTNPGRQQPNFNPGWQEQPNFYPNRGWQEQQPNFNPNGGWQGDPQFNNGFQNLRLGNLPNHLNTIMGHAGTITNGVNMMRQLGSFLTLLR